jgi:hypothetical protein
MVVTSSGVVCTQEEKKKKNFQNNHKKIQHPKDGIEHYINQKLIEIIRKNKIT